MRHRGLGVVVVRLVARNARGHRDVVVVINVAVGADARRIHMRAHQRPARRRVVELAIGPEHSIVARLASRREACMRHRRLGVVVVGLVAGDAGRHRNVVVVVDVAIGADARWIGMRSGQHKAGRGVVEFAIRPEHGVVAVFARRREPAMRNRRGRVVVVRLVARDAGRDRNVVVVVDVAIRAGSRRHRVRAHQGEPGLGVVEGRRRPPGRRVADIASLRKAPSHVIRILGAIEIVQVTSHAGRAGQVVVVVDVAIGASSRRHHVQASQGEARRRMVKLGIRPGNRVVAGLARRREPAVIDRRLRVVIVRLVARDAGRDRDVVVVVDMAVRAYTGRIHMRAGQRERSLGMVEGGRLPGGRVVAGLARGREPTLHVVRILGVIEIRLVARHAGRDRDVVVVIDVAVGASPRRNRVPARQGKASRRVVELAIRPGHRVVAVFAGGREAGMWQRRCRAVIILLVAADAELGGQIVVVVDVAVGASAWRIGMGSQEHEADQRVVKRRRRPGSGRMAGFAGLREAPGHVVRIRRVLESLDMAAGARRGRQIVIVVDVAIDAGPWRHGVSTGQREARRRVIELRVQPVVGRVARFAGRLESRAARSVVRIRRGLEFLHVARQTIGRHCLKLAVAGILVAGVAIHGGVRAGQREAVVVILDLLDGNAPPPHGVALLAVRAQGAFVNVGVAVLALGSNIAENQLDVAGGTGDAHVHAAQGILGLVVIEFWNGSDRLPALRGVAVLARDIETAVRTLRRGNTLLLPVRQRREQQQQQQDAKLG